MRGWRPFTWVIVVINILFLVLAISAIAAGGSEVDEETLRECREQATEFFTEEDCLAANEAGQAVGAGIALTGIIVFWVLIDIILGIIWLVTNRKKRECPVCGSDVKKGVTVCKKCGYDFKTGTSPQQTPT